MLNVRGTDFDVKYVNDDEHYDFNDLKLGVKNFNTEDELYVIKARSHWKWQNDATYGWHLASKTYGETPYVLSQKFIDSMPLTAVSIASKYVYYINRFIIAEIGGQDFSTSADIEFRTKKGLIDFLLGESKPEHNTFSLYTMDLINLDDLDD